MNAFNDEFWFGIKGKYLGIENTGRNTDLKYAIIEYEHISKCDVLLSYMYLQKI